MTDEIIAEVEENFEYLNECFPKKHPILISLNIPSVYFVGKRAKEDKIEVREFYKFIIKFYNDHGKNINPTGGNITKNKINITNLMMDYYNQYFSK